MPQRTTKDTLSKLTTYFYKESVVHPFVQMEATNKGLIISDKDYVDIIYYIENSGLSALSIILVFDLCFSECVKVPISDNTLSSGLH